MGSAFIVVLSTQVEYCHAFRTALPPRSDRYVGRERIKLCQLGNDYLDSISANRDGRGDDDDGDVVADDSADVKLWDSPVDSFKSALNDAASNVSLGIASITERGSSDVRSLTSNAQTGARNLARKGTRDIKRTTVRAQKAVKKTAGGLAGAGRGLSDMQFFQQVNFSPKIDAQEIVVWIDAQAKSGTKIVGSNAKTLVLKFTGKKEYAFGDVTKELIHRVASQEVNMQDTILLLKVCP